MLKGLFRIHCTAWCELCSCPVKGEEPEKETAPAAPVKKHQQQPLAAQENAAAVQPVKAAAAAAEVSGDGLISADCSLTINLVVHL